MQKKIIALAIAAAFSAPAFADVVVTGGLQAEVVSIGGDAYQAPVAAAYGASPAAATAAVPARSANGLYAVDGWEAGLQNSGNYGFLKFAATEDLGDGMKAIAVYTLNANVGDTGTAGLGGRDAYIGLSGSMGTVLGGTLSTPYKSSTASYDPFLATAFQARGNNGMSTWFNGYMSNALAYANNFMDNQVKVVAAVVLDEKADTTTATTDATTAKHAKSISVNFDPSADLDISLAMIDGTDMGSATTTGTVAKATKIGAKYNMGAITLAGQIEMLDNSTSTVDAKGNVTFLSASFKMDTANTVSASYGSTDKKITGGTDNDTYMAVGLNHAFSKKTSGTVAYRSSKFNGQMTETAIGAGLRVNF